MRRKICMLLAALVLCGALPARAAGRGEVLHRTLGSNGAVTVGIQCTVGPDGTEWGAGTEFVYTTDGANWQKSPSPVVGIPTRGGWNGTEFLAYDMLGDSLLYRSADGVHWTYLAGTERGEVVQCTPGAADAGGYHFELDQDGELWVVDGDRAALLPDVGQGGRARATRFTAVQAYQVPGGAVRVEAATDYYAECRPYVADYLPSSLDWVLDNLAQPWAPAVVEQTSGGGVTLRQVAVGPKGHRWETSADGETWTALPVTWANGSTLLPYNGRTFLVQDGWSLRLYASENGRDWRSLEDTFLAADISGGLFGGDTTNYAAHAIHWTGTEYVACRRAVEGRYGMMGSSGGRAYSPYNTKVCFADENFDLTGSYDFGRQVLGAGYYGGAWYAIVSDSEGVSTLEYDRDAPAHLYTSTDKQTWTKTDYLQIMDALQSWA